MLKSWFNIMKTNKKTRLNVTYIKLLIIHF